MAGLGNGQNAFRKINIAPLQSHEFPYTQTAVKTKNSAVQLIFLSVKDCLLYLFLLGKRKTLNRLFFEFRAFEFVRCVFLC